MGAWSTTTSLTTAIYYNMCIGSHDDCFSIGGAGPVSSVNKFNGSTWSTTSALVGGARYQIFAAGCTGNALAYGGYTGAYICFTATEKFSGSTWSTTTNLLSSRGFGGSLASSNPNIGTMAVCGLQNSTGSPQTTNEYWNGSIWAVTSLLNLMRTGSYCAGNMSRGMCCGSGTSADIWDGSAWSTTTALGKVRFQHGVAGTSTNWVLVYGGYTGASIMTLESELWTGSSWSTATAWLAAQGMYGFGFCGTGESAFCAGGYGTGSGSLSQVIRYKSDGDGSFRVWSLTNSLNTPRHLHTSFGDSTSAIAATGAGAAAATSERWSGSSWATTGNVNTSCAQAMGFGDATAGILVGGYNTASLTRTEIWNGSVWNTSSAVLSLGTYIGAGIGSTTTGLSIAGITTGGAVTTVSKWNSSAWVTFAPLPAAKFYIGACGITSAVLVPGGAPISSPASYTFLGSSWATTTLLNIARERNAVCGSTSSAISSGGTTAAGNPSAPSLAALDSCEHWNGVTWSVLSALNMGRMAHTHVGNEAIGLVAGGSPDCTFSFSSTEISSSTNINSPYYTIEGEVDITMVPATGGRTVRLYKDSDGGLLDSTTSHITTGKFNFNVTDGNRRYFAIAFPSTGENYNAVIQDNISPIVHIDIWPYSGVWTTTNGLLTPRYQCFVAGVTSKAIAVSGYTGATVCVTNVEVWSGSAWATTGACLTGRYGLSILGSGTRTIITGGYNTTLGNISSSEYYGGSTWATTTTLTLVRTYAGYVGSIGTGLLCGGMDGNTTAPLDYTTRWDGGTWTTTCGMLYPQSLCAVLGNTSAAIAAGGRKSGNNNEMYHQCERWDSTVWSVTSPLNYSGYVFSGTGSTNRGLIAGQYVRSIYPSSASLWNGSAWSTTVGSIQSAPSILCGFADAALMGGQTVQSELFRQTMSLSGLGTWTTTGSINVGRQQGAGAGNTGSALFFTGYTAGGVNNSEYWNGTTWANTTAHTISMWSSLGLGGNSSSVMSVCGATGVGVAYDGVYLWSGSSWDTTTVFPTNKYGIAGVGDTTSALVCKGYTTTNTIDTYNWNSSSWSTTSSANAPSRISTMWGVTSNSMIAGGLGSFNTGTIYTVSDTVEKWDGSSWSITSNLLVPTVLFASAGTTSSAIVYGGNISDSGSIKTLDNTFRWTGAAWSLTTNMLISRGAHSGVGTMSNALAFGGNTSENTTYPVTTEKWSYI